MIQLNKLNLGCGPYKEEDFINIDINSKQNPDMVYDLTMGIPFPDNTAEIIQMFHFLEHLDSDNILNLLSECYRVLVNKGWLDIIVPIGITGELDHKHIFTEESFHLFEIGEDCSLYFNKLMNFQFQDKKIFSEPTMPGRVNMRVRFKAIK